MAAEAFAYEIVRLSGADVARFRALTAMFGAAFDAKDDYGSKPPSDAYIADLLEGDQFIALAALDGAHVMGGLAAYALKKFEQERKEIYIYDLAVDAAYRRRGVATQLIERLKPIAAESGAWVIYVQADVDDAPAVALYDKLGVRERVLHFDIAPQ